MTELAITPKWKDKEAKFKGVVAAGEHVAVTIQNDDGSGGAFISDTETLRLNVIDPTSGRLLATFPTPVEDGETPETWSESGTQLSCELNLNTVQMLKAVLPASVASLLFVLDDYENKTLYFKAQHEVAHWPRRRGEEEPLNLDGYKDIIRVFGLRLTAVEETATSAAASAASAAAVAERLESDVAGHRAVAEAAASAARTAKSQAESIAANVIAARDQAVSAGANAVAAAVAASNAADRAETAQAAAEAALPIDKTLTKTGKAADAKSVGDAIASSVQRAETAEASLAADINTEIAARTAADQSHSADIQALSQNKANKSELSAFINNGYYDSNTKKIILRHDETAVVTISATEFIKDGMVSSVEIVDGYLVISFNTDAGLSPISIPLTGIFNPANFYNKSEADGKFVAKETGKALSSNDYTDGDKAKLDGVAAGAQVNDALAIPTWAITCSETYSSVVTLRLNDGAWDPGFFYDGGWVSLGTPKGDVNSTRLTWTQGVDGDSDIVADRRGVQLGSDTTHVLASQIDMAAAQQAVAELATHGYLMRDENGVYAVFPN